MNPVKNICFNVSPLNMDEVFPRLNADEIITAQILDQCGNVVMTLPCSKEDCTVENECCSNPTILYGNLNIEAGQTGTACGDGIVNANKVIADELQGDGSKVTNTDDTRVTSFQYNALFDRLELQTANPNDENSERMFTVQTDMFTHNTVIEKFEYEQQNSNTIILKDSDGNEWKVDLTRFVYDGETFIAGASCDQFGHFKMWYNREDMSPINVDISPAIQNLDKYVTGGFLNNETLVLTRKNDTPIRINLYDLIAGIKCAPDTKISCIEWCGNSLIIKESNGKEWEISFVHLIDQIIDEIIPNEITGGCVLDDNTIILHRRNGSDLEIGTITDNDTKLVSVVWKPNPTFPDDPKKLTLRLNNSDGTNIDINFSELINRIPCNDTFITEGSISKSPGLNNPNSRIILRNNLNEDVIIDGLVNTDTRVVSGQYDNFTNDENRLVLQESNGNKIIIDLRRLIEDCTNQHDKYLKRATIVGNDVLQLEVEGAPTLHVPLSRFRNVDQSIKTMVFDKNFGTLTITDAQGATNTALIYKATDFKYISQVEIMNGTHLYIKQENGQSWMLQLPNKYVVSGTYNNNGNTNSTSPSITLTNNDNTTVTISNVENTFATALKVFDDTLRLEQNNGTNLNVKMTSVIDLAANKAKLTGGTYNPLNGDLQLNYANPSDCITVTGLPTNQKIVGQVTLGYNVWNGSINYYINGNSVIVNMNIVPGTAPNTVIGNIPVALPFTINKYITGTLLGNTISVPITISTSGDIELTGSIPDSIQDSFTLVLQ